MSVAHGNAAAAATQCSSFELFQAIRDRIDREFAPGRWRDRAHKAMRFILWKHGHPGRRNVPFPLDRRALADHPDIGLSEGVFRETLKRLREAGLVERPEAAGSRYRATENGLRRKPDFYRLPADLITIMVRAAREAGRKVKEAARAVFRASTAGQGLKGLLGLPKGPVPEPSQRIDRSKAPIFGMVSKPSRSLAPAPADSDPSLEGAIARLLAAGLRRPGS